jgi:FkbM family methyltransferase
LRSSYIAAMRFGGRVRRATIGLNRGERYDFETSQVLERVLKAGSVCIDLGAHEGEILKLMLRFAPDGRHHAIEALPHLADKLRERFPNVIVHSCAVGQENGEARFNYCVDRPAYSGLQKRTYPRDDVEIREITVPVRRLDDLISEKVVVRCIKADIEGGEYHAFQGARRLIERSRPVIVFEFAKGGAGHYRITPEIMYQLVHDEFGMNVSTMKRWLAGDAPMSLVEFAESFENNIDVYFIAYPA